MNKYSMLSFKEYLKESKPAGNYVSIDVETPVVISSLEKLFGGSYVCDPKDQHATVMYSTGTNVPRNKILDTLHHWDQEIECKVTGVAAFDSTPKDGKRSADECTIVLKIDSVLLHEIHQRLIDDRGLKHSYADYSPHVSILYNLPIEQKQKAIDTITNWLPGNLNTVTLRGWNVEPIVKDWAEKR